MDTKEIEKALLSFGHFRVDNNEEINNSECYIFYFVAFNNEIIRSNCIALNTNILEKLERNTSYTKFLATQDSILKTYSNSDINDLQFSIYKIEKTDDKKHYNNLIKLMEKARAPESLIKSSYKHFNEYYKIYSGIFTIYLLVYTMIIHIILNRSGQSIDVIQGIEVILGMFGLFLFTIIGLYTSIFIVGFILGVLNGNITIEMNWIPYIVGFFLLSFLISRFIKRKTNLHYKIYSFKYNMLSSLIEFIGLFNIGMIIVVMLVTATYPWIFLLESVKSSGVSKDYAGYSSFYEIYYYFSSYQRIGLENNKKYIINGTDKINYFAHDLNKTINYIYSDEKKDKIQLKQLCLNIQNEISKDGNKDEVSIIYNILAESNYNYTKNYQYISVKDENLTFVPFTLHNMGFDDKEIINLQQKCKEIIKK